MHPERRDFDPQLKPLPAEFCSDSESKLCFKTLNFCHLTNRACIWFMLALIKTEK